MSKKKNFAEDAAAEIAEEITAEETAVTEAAAQADDAVVEEAVDAVVEEAAAQTEETIGDIAEDAAECAAEPACGEETVETEEDKNLFALVSKIVEKLKTKFSEGKCKCKTEDEEEDSDDTVSLESDDIILDDDIIAELREQERKEQFKKMIMIACAGIASVILIISLICKAKKKNKD